MSQFAIIPSMFDNISSNKSKKHWSKFDWENFILDYFFVDWKDLLKTDKLSADDATRIYIDKINMLLDTYEWPLFFCSLNGKNQKTI